MSDCRVINGRGGQKHLCWICHFPIEEVAGITSLHAGRVICGRWELFMCGFHEGNKIHNPWAPRFIRLYKHFNSLLVGDKLRIQQFPRKNEECPMSTLKELCQQFVFSEISHLATLHIRQTSTKKEPSTCIVVERLSFSVDATLCRGSCSKVLLLN